MDSALRDKTWEGLDNKLEEAEEIIGNKRKLETMLRKVKEEAETAPESIVEKVRSEYQERLDDIRALLNPLETEITEAKEAVSIEIKELDAQIESARETLSELEFRFKVGEFEDSVFMEKQNQVKNTLDEILKNQQSLLDSFRKFDSFCSALNSAGAPGEEISGGDVPMPGEPEREPQPEREAGSIIEPQPEYVNPNEWLDDFTSSNETCLDACDKVSQDSDSELFENLAEPAQSEPLMSGTSSSVPEPSGGANSSFSDATPMLIIRSKNGNEKRIPVLPITLTIGREHDNNIEIKDEDAARYHARIVFKNGQYVIESLERSRSTLVNGKQITEAALRDADTVTIGKTTMFFMMEEARKSRA